MRIRIMQLLMALIVLLPNGAHALADSNPGGIVEDLDALLGNIQGGGQGATGLSAGHAVAWAIGVTVASCIILYMVSPALRNKVHAFFGLHNEHEDGREAPAA